MALDANIFNLYITSLLRCRIYLAHYIRLYGKTYVHFYFTLIEIACTCIKLQLYQLSLIHFVVTIEKEQKFEFIYEIHQLLAKKQRCMQRCPGGREKMVGGLPLASWGNYAPDSKMNWSIYKTLAKIYRDFCPPLKVEKVIYR